MTEREKLLSITKDQFVFKATKGSGAGAVVVSRPSKWGNWYVVRRSTIVTERGLESKGPKWLVFAVDKHGNNTGAMWGAWDTKLEAQTFAVELHRRSLLARLAEPDGPAFREDYFADLVGRDVLCWCAPGDPCHGDTCIELANPEHW